MTDGVAMAHPLLGPGDPAPVGVRNPDGQSPFVLICDHAGNAVPAALNGLGLPQNELDRHIGVDIGILGVAERLSDLLDAPLVFQRYSRLVVECNRRHTSPDSIAPVSDGTVVPGNQNLTPAARQARIEAIVEPYHAEIVLLLDAREAIGEPTVLVSMHSFTPSLKARPFDRPWQVGMCYGDTPLFSQCVLAELEAETGLTVGRNEPYGVDMAKDYSIPIHGEERGLPYAEFEIRQDLIADAAGQTLWAERLDPVLRRAHVAFWAR